MASGDRFRCYFCHQLCGTPLETIVHLSQSHQAEKVSLLRPISVDGKQKYKSLHYNLRVKDITDGPHVIIKDDLSLYIPTTASPASKVMKTSTPVKVQEAMSMYLAGGDQERNEREIGEDPDIQRLKQLLPAVTAELKKIDRLDDWIGCLELISQGKLPPDNICFLLFLDVIQYYHSSHIASIRYNDRVKQFWTVGYKLFHSKFLRFMGGKKGLGGGTDCHRLSPDETSINFVVPSVQVLKQETERFIVEADKPGILRNNIAKFAEGLTSGASCKISHDKKICQGFGKSLGEVDLFGHEEPSLVEKSHQLSDEIKLCNRLYEILEHISDKGKEFIEQAIDSEKEELVSVCRKIICNLSVRVKCMKERKLKRNLALQRVQQEAGDNWKTSKLAYAISSIKLQIYRLENSLKRALSCIDFHAQIAAACRGVLHLYSKNQIVELDKQPNFICLRGFEDQYLAKKNLAAELYPRFIRQKSDNWFKVRESARVTGSTIYRALGLRTLKEQTEHYDIVINGKKKPEQSVSVAMEHGTKHEIDAVATIVGEILPAIRPDVEFYEEGCHIIYEEGRVFMVVSPDGCGMTQGKSILAFEIKCPLPGKIYQTDIHYSMPAQYVGQVLSEMAVLGCKELFYICYTPETTAAHVANFDKVLWEKMFQSLQNTYNYGSPERPKRRTEEVRELSELISKYVKEEVKFIGEFQSCVAKKCNCDDKQRDYPNQVYGKHNGASQSDNLLQISVCQALTISTEGKDCFNDIYKLLRTPAKEVQVFMLSDMDRLYKDNMGHAVPIAYGLAGYSLTMDTMRDIIDDVLEACSKEGLHISAISSDAQFYKLAVRDRSNKPLTLLQLAKDTWETCRKMEKGTQVKELMTVNYNGPMRSFGDITDRVEFQMRVVENDGSPRIHGPIVISGHKDRVWKSLLSPPNISELLSCPRQSNPPTANQSLPQGEEILEMLPESVQESLETEILALSGTKLQHPATTCINDEEAAMCSDLITEMEPESLESTETEEEAAYDNASTAGEMFLKCSVDYDKLLEVLVSKCSPRRRKMWESKTTSMLIDGMKNAESISKMFTKPELILILECTRQSEVLKNINRRLTGKETLVNMVSQSVSDGSQICRLKSPKSLRSIIRDILNRKFKKNALNAITATNQFPTDVGKWRALGPFQRMMVGESCLEYTWYSQPEYVKCVSSYVAYVLDTHHLLVNLRALVCRKGLLPLDIHREAWVEVAQKFHKSTNLNIAMVDEIIDKQSNTVAKIMFSIQVEQALTSLGWVSEAKFCRLIREWYEAEDSGGLSAQERFERRVRLREYLLESYRIGTFPPPGSNISGLTVQLYEGIMTNIDRRIQLHAMVRGGAYNVRAPTSLDSENFFGEFQELDPKGTGVLQPDDIPRAFETASYLFQARVDPERNFDMRTSARHRVYPVNQLTPSMELGSDQERTLPCPITDMRHLRLRNHVFDLTKPSKKLERRKRSYVSDVDRPARGTRPIRDFYRRNESKILPHVRMGLTFD